MKLFPGVLAAVMAENAVTQLGLAGETRLAVSQINSFVHGRYRTIAPKVLKKVVHGASANEAQSARLYWAAAQDAVEGSGLMVTVAHPASPTVLAATEPVP